MEDPSSTPRLVDGGQRDEMALDSAGWNNHPMEERVRGRRGQSPGLALIAPPLPSHASISVAICRTLSTRSDIDLCRHHHACIRGTAFLYFCTPVRWRYSSLERMPR